MGQIEVYEWLKKQRSSGDLRYFTAKQVEKGLVEDGLTPSNGYTNGSVKVALLKLESAGYLDARRQGKLTDYNRSFRLKDKYAVKKVD